MNTRHGTSSLLTHHMEQIFKLASSLEGIPYGWWGGNDIEPGPPMWSKNEKLPDLRTITSCNCAGLVNLLLRKIGKPIPHSPCCGVGGTGAYVSYYRDTLCVALPFDIRVNYPTGTLLLRDFRDRVDQGHVAVLLDCKGPKSRVLQSFAHSSRTTSPGINSSYTLAESHAGYYYEYAVPPTDWLV